jgi:hypothetical protein
VVELRAEAEREIVLDEDREIQRKRVEEYRKNQKTCQVMLNREKHKTEALTNDVEIAREELLASQANEAELKHNLKQHAKALADAKAAAASAIAAMATPNATNSGSQELAKLVAQRDQLHDMLLEHEQSTRELVTIIKTKKKLLKQEKTAKDLMQSLLNQAKRKIKNLAYVATSSEKTIQAKRETAKVATKEQRAKWRAHKTRVAKEKELELKHEKKLLRETFSREVELERSSAAAKLTRKDEEITAMMTHQERETKMLQEKLDAREKEADLDTKDQQIAELKKAAAENEVECTICFEAFDKSDTNQWKMMLPCCHVFCLNCVENHENEKMPEATLPKCPNCETACESFLQAKIGGVISDDAMAMGIASTGK